MSEKSTPIESFKRNTAACLRAVAGRDDLDVAFVPNGQGLVGKEARLTMPGRALDSATAALTRGEADAVALRLRYHNGRLHARTRPKNQTAREIFDAVEQSRCEALGMRRMAGCASNLDARLEETCRNAGFARATSRDDVPLSEALGVLARELPRWSRPYRLRRPAGAACGRRRR